MSAFETEIKFKLEKETKSTVVYIPVNADAEESFCQRVYIRKTSLPKEPPKRIKLTLEF